MKYCMLMLLLISGTVFATEPTCLPKDGAAQEHKHTPPSTQLDKDALEQDHMLGLPDSNTRPVQYKEEVGSKDQLERTP